MTYRKLYENGVKALDDAGVADSKIDAKLLLEFACKTDRNYLYAHGEDEVGAVCENMYQMFIDMRTKRIPLQHITGEQEFMGLTFYVNENVLIPRQDTEVLVEEAMLLARDGDSLLDLCTGSGCVLISIARYKNDLDTVGADISQKALEVANKNAEKLLDHSNCKKPLFINSDLFGNIEGRFDIITANPPYIQTDVIKTLSSEVKDHDPMLALDGGEDGLLLIRKIISQAPKHLNSGGWLLLEIGYDQGQSTKDLFIENGFCEVSIIKDLSENDRVVRGKYNVCKM